jgi:hypothetical protein
MLLATVVSVDRPSEPVTATESSTLAPSGAGQPSMPSRAEPAAAGAMRPVAEGPPPIPPTSVPRPSPSPTPSSTGQPGQSDQDDGCGLSLTCRARKAIDDWFRSLAKSAINPVIGALGNTVLSSPRVDQTDRVKELWSFSALITNISYVLLVLMGGILLMSHGSVQTSYTVKDIAPRLVVGFVASNVSLLLIGKAIELANGLSGALMGQGVPVDEAAERIKQLIGGIILASLTGRGPLILTIVALIGITLALVLMLIYLIRIMLLTLLTAAAPLALACHALPQTNGLARLWWRAFTAVLAIQVAQALVLITTLRIFFDPSRSVLFAGANPIKSFLDLLLLICLLYILIRIPSWISRMVFQHGMSHSPIARIVRYAIAAAVFRRAVPALAGRSGGLIGAATGSTRRPPPNPQLPKQTTSAPPSPTGTPQRWVQQELPMQWPTQRGKQTTLPINPPRGSGQRWTQLRLPAGHTRTPSWQQTRLPIDIHAEQLQLPLQIPPQHHQQELPVAFPQPGSPQAGSARRAQVLAAQRHAAEKKARARAFQQRLDAVRRAQTSPPDLRRWGGWRKQQ